MAENKTGKPFPFILQELNEDKIRQLAEEGYDINARRDKNGRTLLMEAAEAGNTGIVRLPVKYGADINLRDNERKPVLFWCAAHGSPEIMRYLIERGARLDIIDSFGYSLLDYNLFEATPIL